MSDCCPSSPQDKHSALNSTTLPSFAVRPGVTFPDWSLVTSPAVKDALQAMVGSDHVLNRWAATIPSRTASALPYFSFTQMMDEPRPQARLQSAQR